MGGAASASQTAPDGDGAGGAGGPAMPTVKSFHGGKLVSKFSPDEEAQLKIRFQAIAPNALEAGVTKDQFISAIVGRATGGVFMDRIFKMFDQDSNGMVDFEEYVFAASLLSSRVQLEDKMKFLFKIYDINDDNVISMEEVETLLASCIAMGALPLTQEQCKQIVKDTFTGAESNADGNMTWENFSALVTKGGKQSLHWMTVDILEHLPTSGTAAVAAGGEKESETSPATSPGGDAAGAEAASS